MSCLIFEVLEGGLLEKEMYQIGDLIVREGYLIKLLQYVLLRRLVRLERFSRFFYFAILVTAGVCLRY